MKLQQLYYRIYLYSVNMMKEGEYNEEKKDS